MLDSLFSSPTWWASARRSWLWSLIEGFLRHLAVQQYARGTLRGYASRLLAFAAFTTRQGVCDVRQLFSWLDPFVAQVPTQAALRRPIRALLARFLRHLQEAQVIPAPLPPPLSPDALLIEAHLQLLHEQRGLAPATLHGRRHLYQALLTFLTAAGLSGFRSLQPEHLHRFIIDQGARYSRQTLHAHCSMLRDFLSFLHQRRVLATALAAAVVSPRVYQHEQCPRFLTRAEVEAVLAAVNRDTPIGRRDYAMLLLLALYGLRGGEVLKLRLDDIDWRKQLLHIRRRKAGNCTTYPLSAAAGEAVLAYLRDGRPENTPRQVFLTTVAPFTPLAGSSTLACRIKQYLALAGVRVARPGTHSFRYSCAQRLLDQGLPLKSIGDYLGHQDSNTTQRYTAIALEQLREVATGDGEALL